VGVGCCHEMGIGEALVLQFESALFDFLQVLLHLTSLLSVPVSPSVEFLAVLLLAGAAEEAVSHSVPAPPDGAGRNLFPWLSRRTSRTNTASVGGGARDG
jgi:hypothetical protein